jgi:hypothetical protein
MPLAGGIGGAVVLIVGILLARRREPGVEYVVPLSAMAPPAAADAVSAPAATGAPPAADPTTTDGTGTA